MVTIILQLRTYVLCNSHSTVYTCIKELQQCNSHQSIQLSAKVLQNTVICFLSCCVETNTNLMRLVECPQCRPVTALHLLMSATATQHTLLTLLYFVLVTEKNSCPLIYYTEFTW